MVTKVTTRDRVTKVTKRDRVTKFFLWTTLSRLKLSPEDIELQSSFYKVVHEGEGGLVISHLG